MSDAFDLEAVIVSLAALSAGGPPMQRRVPSRPAGLVDGPAALRQYHAARAALNAGDVGGAARALDDANSVLQNRPLDVLRRQVLALMERAGWASRNGRCVRSAELNTEALALAKRTFPPDSLVVYSLALDVADAHRAHALQDNTDEKEKRALFSRAWNLVMEASVPLIGRLKAGRLLPGCCTEEEETFLSRAELKGGWVHRIKGKPDHIGYSVFLTFAVLCAKRMYAMPFTTLLPPPSWQEWKMADSVMLATTLMAGHSSILETELYHEIACATLIKGLIAPRLLLPDFQRALEAAFNSAAVVAGYHARGVLSSSVSKKMGDAQKVCAQNKDEDKTKYGLWKCDLSSCGVRETSVFQFKRCAQCLSVAYCCEEHCHRNWKEGHRRSCKDLLAKREERKRQQEDSSRIDEVP